MFEEDDRLFIAQEYIDGKTYWKLLQERRKCGSAFSGVEIMQWLRDLLPVLDYLHRQNIVHRDISPDNIMLPNGKRLPVLIDFGVVKQATPHIYEMSVNPDGSIQASVSVGKFGYAPYEQIRIGQCSPRSDLYALAVTAVVLLTGKPPNLLIDSASLEWKWRSHANVSPAFAKILEKMMAEKPQDRYSSAKTVLRELNLLDSLLEARSPSFEQATYIQPDEDQPDGVIQIITEPFDLQSSAKIDLREVVESEGLESTRLELTGNNRVELSPPTQITQVTRSEEEDIDSPILAVHASFASDRSVITGLPDSSTLPTSGTQLKILVEQKPEPFLPPLKKVLLFSCLAILPFGGVMVGMQSPHIASLCQTLNNCATEQQLDTRYRRAIQQANGARDLAENAQSIEELQVAHDRLAKAITQLTLFTRDTGVYASAQNVLSRHRNLLQTIEHRLDKETRAAQLLQRAETEAQQADQQTKAATTRQEYEAAKSLWRKALATLGAIPQSTFVASQVTARSQHYTAQIQTVEQRMATVQPQPSTAPRQRSTPPTNPSASVPSPSASLTPQTSPSSAPQTPSAPQAQSKPEPQPNGFQPSSPLDSSQGIPSQPQPPSDVYSPIALAPTPDVRSDLPQADPPPNTVTRENVALSSIQTLSNVSIWIDGARINPRGTFVANLVVENSSDRSFGFIPLFAEVRDSNGETITARVLFHGSEDAVVEPGESLRGEVYVLDRHWNSSGSQNLTLMIQEGTSGNRRFHIPF
ncbi:MAG: protein kinase [Cyanobacteria bacterium CRU_2_1]|nr:protein kinase [Cyanobacteria bacterium CRU_2_1]